MFSLSTRKASVPDLFFPRNFFQDFWNNELQGNEWKDIVPEMAETDDEIRISFELPGYDRNTLSVTCEAGGVLAVSGERSRKSAQERFDRRYALPQYVDLKTLEASYKDGVLTVAAQKLAESKPRKIEIK